MDRITQPLQSWGRFPQSTPDAVVSLPSTVLDDTTLVSKLLSGTKAPLLAHGLGRSYGDVCLNNGGTLVHTVDLSGIREFDATTGRLRAGAGTSLSTILRYTVPLGWTLVVVPGTKWVTVGGAIANDIHGKNHHKVGSFGNHVCGIEIWRQGAMVSCSPTEQPELFAATVGGLGLTGIMISAELQLMPITSRHVDVHSTKLQSLDAMIESLLTANETHQYTVGWFDAWRERGLLQSAVPALHGDLQLRDSRRIRTPRAAQWLLRDSFIGLGNALYYHKQIPTEQQSTVGMMSFFFPLDVADNWNIAYGKDGFLQYQFVVPFNNGPEYIRTILSELRRSDVHAYLAVIKTFGDVQSVGMMSFPMPGITLALDVRNTLPAREALERCDKIVLEAGGRVYLAKDARLSTYSFAQMYGTMREKFEPYIDPTFSSSLWRRCTGVDV